MGEALSKFLAKVEKQPNGCWYWAGGKDGKGYGLVRLPGHRAVKAHRLSFQLYNFDPGRLQVNHRCDNPLCVNPDHLYVGTQKENVADRIARGRSASGERNGKAKLNAPKVRVIHRLLEQGYLSKSEIADLFAVNRKVISKIASGTNWSQVTGRGVDYLREGPDTTCERR